VIYDEGLHPGLHELAPLRLQTTSFHGFYCIPLNEYERI